MKNSVCNTMDKERPYSCPKCGGVIQSTAYVQYNVYYSVDPITGEEREEGESHPHEQVDTVYRCKTTDCDWQIWADDLFSPEDRRLPESICDSGDRSGSRPFVTRYSAR
jgi:hypothetical protein